MSRKRQLLAAAAIFVCAIGRQTATAQVRTLPLFEPKWTADVYVGGTTGSTPSGGSAGKFPPGTTFRTEPGFPSRANPSWFFGDGAALFNDVNAQFASRFGLRFPQLVPLDGVLTSASVERGGGAAWGVRVTRRLTRRLAAEFTFDRSQSSLRLSQAARDAIEASRASFERAFSGLLATIPQTGLRVVSSAEIDEADAAEQTVTGVLTLTVFRRGRIEVHALGGAGRIFSQLDATEARLAGNYQFRFIDTYAIDETDRVTVRFSSRSTTTIGVLGAGLTADVSPRHGVRADVRLFLGPSGLSTSVDASPSTGRAVPSLTLPSNTSPSIQFSTNAADPSSLSGSIAGLTTFTGSGLDRRVALTVGYFVRF